MRTLFRSTPPARDQPSRFPDSVAGRPAREHSERQGEGQAISGPPGHKGNRETGGRGRSDRYTYRITWSAEDGENVGLCAEFPSLSWLAPSPEKALSGIKRLVREVVSDMQAAGETPPEPLADKAYSGRFLVRVPPETHRALAMRAAEEGVSLNRLVSVRLAGGLG